MVLAADLARCSWFCTQFIETPRRQAGGRRRARERFSATALNSQRRVTVMRQFRRSCLVVDFLYVFEVADLSAFHASSQTVKDVILSPSQRVSFPRKPLALNHKNSELLNQREVHFASHVGNGRTFINLPAENQFQFSGIPGRRDGLRKRQYFMLAKQ